MSVLQALTDAIRDRSVAVIDLTAPLSEATPIIQLPAPFGNTARFGLTEISRYDERGPAWYWNDIVTGEHTGTHFDAPVHWVTGKDREDAARVPVARMIAPAVVLDFSAEAAADPDFLLEIEHVKQWEAEHGPLPGQREAVRDHDGEVGRAGQVDGLDGHAVLGDQGRGLDDRLGHSLTHLVSQVTARARDRAAGD